VVKTERLEGVEVEIQDGAVVVTAEGTVLTTSETIYNSGGQVQRTIAADGQMTDFVYDPQGRQVATIGHPLPAEEVGLGGQYAGKMVRHRMETGYDQYGQRAVEWTNIVQVEEADGTLVEVDRDAARQTEYHYDEHGREVKIVFDDGTSIEAEYDEFGRKTAETNQLGLTRTFEYNADGRLVAVELPAVPDPHNDNQPTRPRYVYGYDAQGNQTLIRDPLGRETRFAFAANREQLTRTLPLGLEPEGGFTEEFQYDERGRQKLHISFEGVVTEDVYSDTTGRLIEKRFFDNLTQYADGTGTASEVWTYKHDAFGRESEVTQDDGNVSRTVQKGYDTQGRLVEVHTPEGVITYGYDALGRKTEMKVFAAGSDPLVDSPQRVTTYGYDSLGRLKTVIEDLDPADTENDLLATVYSYDVLGNLARTDLPNGVITVYAYDPLNRLTELTHYEPDSPGPLDPENLDTNLSDNQPLARFEYAVRADGRRTSVTETFWLDADSDPQTAPTPHVNRIDWTYDDIGRLTDEAFNHFDDDLDRIESFVYDLVSNRVEKWLNTDPQFDENGVPAETIADELVASLYDANDRLIESNAYTAPDPQTPGWTAQDGDLVQTTTYGYAQTQQTVKEVKTAAGQRISKLGFAYDLQGRLWRATTEGYTAGELSSRERVTYDYDATGIRVGALAEIDSQLDPELQSWQPATRTEFLVDHHNFTGYQQVIKETTYDDQDAITKTIEYTIGLDEIAQTVTPYANGQPGAESAETHIFAHDGHGSVRVLTDLAAAAVQFYAFDAYGQMLAIWNAAAQIISGGTGQYADPSLAHTNLLYSGEQFDTRIGQQYLRARYYDPTTGRFNCLDPFFGNQSDPLSFHKYLYSHGTPVNGRDPSGESFTSAMVAGLALGVLGAVAGYRMFPLAPYRGAALGFGVGFTLGFGFLGGFALLGTWYTGLYFWQKVAVVGPSLVGLAALLRYNRYQLGADPAPANLTPEWTRASLLGKIDTMDLPEGAAEADRAIAKQSLTGLLDQTYQQFRQNPNPAPGEACHVFCLLILGNWMDHVVERDSDARTKRSRFFKVAKTVYERDDRVRNTHGTILIAFADGSKAHIDNGWFAVNAMRLSPATKNLTLGESNIPANYRLTQVSDFR
jgi:RHS repeat-associated protein